MSNVVELASVLPLKFKNEIIKFLNTDVSAFSFSRGAWARIEDMGVYLRIQTRWSHAFGRRACIDVANVYVSPVKQGQGYLSAILTLVEAHASGRIVFVENVLEQGQFGIYERRGYTMLPPRPGEEECEYRCFYKDMA